MKTLMLLRHAEAAYSGNSTDFDRPLERSGTAYIRDRLAPRLVKEKLLPDFVLCSPARRTKETLALLLPDTQAEINYVPELYDGSAGGYLEQIKEAADRADTLLLVGHNPSIHQLVAFLTGSADNEMGRRLQSIYSPGTLAVFACDVQNWKDLQPGSNELTHLFYP